VYDLSPPHRVIYSADHVFEAPNWSAMARICSSIPRRAVALPLDQKPLEPHKLDLGPVTAATTITASPRRPSPGHLRTRATPASQVYVSASDGSGARLVTPNYPSYFHGWSPDGSFLAFVGQRGGIFNLYRILADGSGQEQRLTSRPANDDGPEYSPTASGSISTPTVGSWDIWRMPADGRDPRLPSATGHLRRLRGLVPALLARRQMDGLSLFQKGTRPPANQESFCV